MLRGMAAQTTIDVTALARACAGHAGVRLVALFGSVVREAARADSDVDVAVLGGEFWDQCADREIGRSDGALGLIAQPDRPFLR